MPITMRRMLSQTPGYTAAFMASSEQPKVQIRTSVIQRFQQTLKKKKSIILSPQTILLFFFQFWKNKNIALQFENNNINTQPKPLLLSFQNFICCFLLNSKHSFPLFFFFLLTFSFQLPFHSFFLAVTNAS